VLRPPNAAHFSSIEMAANERGSMAGRGDKILKTGHLHKQGEFGADPRRYASYYKRANMSALHAGEVLLAVHDPPIHVSSNKTLVCGNFTVSGP